MRLSILLCAATLAACSSNAARSSEAEADAEEVLIYRAGEAPDEVEAHLARMKAVIRQDIVTAYDATCDGVSVPDNAFIPVEITGGGLPEMAVSMLRVECKRGANMFAGSGGQVVQFWIGSGGPVRLMLEQQMHGFTPGDAQLQVVAHGAFCPDGAGPDVCIVTYRWEPRLRLMLPETMVKGSEAPMPPAMEYDYEDLYPVKPDQAASS